MRHSESLVASDAAFVRVSFAASEDTSKDQTMTTYQALVHVWTPDYKYWNPIGPPQTTYADAVDQTHIEANKFWPNDTNLARRDAFLRRCKIVTKE